MSVALPRHGRGIGTVRFTRASQILSVAGHGRLGRRRDDGPRVVIVRG